jgi:hypothetical protein
MSTTLTNKKALEILDQYFQNMTHIKDGINGFDGDDVNDPDAKAYYCYQFIKQSVHTDTHKESREVVPVEELLHAPLQEIAKDLDACCSTWTPDACLVGNVRAIDIRRLIAGYKSLLHHFDLQRELPPETAENNNEDDITKN